MHDPLRHSTPSPVDQTALPGDEATERILISLERRRPGGRAPSAPGAVADTSYASVATLYEVGLNHFFRKDHPRRRRPRCSFQGHRLPGPLRACLLEASPSEEANGRIPSAGVHRARPALLPAPRPARPLLGVLPICPALGLGPAEAIYQACALHRYLHMNGIKGHVPAHLGLPWRR